VLVRGERAHVRSHFTHHRHRRDRGDSRNGLGQRHRLGKRGDRVIDLLLRLGDGGVEKVNLRHELLQEEALMGLQAALQGCAQLRALRAQSPTCQLGQGRRILGASEQGIKHRAPARTQHVAGDRRELESGALQHLLDAIDDLHALLDQRAAMAAPDRAMAERLHAIITASAPALAPKTWYGQPAYAKEGKDGKVVCFFQPAEKFKTRYATLGFNDAAHLDEGAMWPVAFALKELTAADEAKIVALVKQAVS
jgi:hypothetical protein